MSGSVISVNGIARFVQGGEKPQISGALVSSYLIRCEGEEHFYKSD